MRLNEMFDKRKQDFKDLFEHYGAAKSLRWLKEEAGEYIAQCTDRNEYIELITEEWIDMMMINYQMQTFGNHLDKVNAAKIVNATTGYLMELGMVFEMEDATIERRFDWKMTRAANRMQFEKESTNANR